MLHTRIDRPCASHIARLVAGMFASVFAAAAFADDATIVDPPDRVARVSFVAGAVSLLAADTDEWVDATLNRPLTNGDKLWVDRDARAELQVGTATIHLDENTGFSFVALDDDVLQANLSDGAMAIEVRSIDPHERIEIDTPNATVVLPQAGDYTISTEAAGDRTIVNAHAGEAIVSGADQHEFIVAANQQGVFTGNQELSAETVQIGGRGPFETWAYQRNHAETGSVAARYVAPGVVGYQDLDAYGSWAYEPEYGQVWQPTTLIYTDWAPYRYGRWTWIQPWGWTWIDDAPWGFAPFHYGRWAYLRQRWCWLPGPMHARPIYAPALVAWSGNPRAPYGPYMGFDNVAWFPLGPREVFLPAYRTSWTHFRAVNASNATFADSAYLSNAYSTRNVHVDYRNRDAITVVDRNAFALSQRTAGHRVHVDAGDVAYWQPQAAAPAIVPTRDAMLGARPLGHDPTPRLDRQITIVHPDDSPTAAGRPANDRDDERYRTRNADADQPRVWHGSNVPTTPPPTPAPGGNTSAPRGADQRRPVDRPPATERPPFHYNGAYQNNGAFHDDGRYEDNGRAQPDRPPADSRTRNPTNVVARPDASPRPNGPTQPREVPAETPRVEPRPMPSEPAHRSNIEVRQPPHDATPREVQPARPANGAANSRTMGQAHGSNLNGGGHGGHIGNAQDTH